MTLQMRSTVENNCYENKDIAHCSTYSSECYHIRHLCTYTRSLIGESRHCRGTEHLLYCYKHECPTQYKCSNSFCIPLNLVCDGIHDCPDGEDEDSCDSLSCPGLIKCKYDNVCVHPRQLCDGIIDCLYSEDDESLCSVAECPSKCKCCKYMMLCVDLKPTIIIDVNNFHALVVRNSKIDKKFFKGLRYLKYLDISGNKQLTPESLKLFLTEAAHLLRLTLINLQLYYLKSETFYKLSELVSVNFSTDVIKSIHHHAFSGLAVLSVLNLTGIGLEHVASCAFCFMSSLTIVDLSDNNLTILEQNMLMFQTSHIVNVILYNNSIHALRADDFYSEDYTKNLTIHSDDIRLCCFLPQFIPICSSPDTMSRRSTICAHLIPHTTYLRMYWSLAVILLLLNLSVILYHILASSDKYHYLLLQGLAVVDSLYCCYLHILLGSHETFDKQLAFHIEEWLWGDRCLTEILLVIIGLFMSKYIACIIAINQLLLTKYCFTQTSLSVRKIISLLLLGTGISFAFSFTITATTRMQTTLACLPFSNLNQASFKGQLIGMFCLSCMAVLCMVTTICHAETVRYVHHSGNKVGRKHTGQLVVLLIRCIVGSVIAVYQLICLFFYSWVNKKQLMATDTFIIAYVLPLTSLLNPFLYTFLSFAFCNFCKQQLAKMLHGKTKLKN